MLMRFLHIKCSSFSKFFLLKFATHYGEKSPWLNQVKDIIRAAELPESRFYTAVNELRSLGILEVQKSKPSEIPQIRYWIKTEEQAICQRSLCNLPHLHKDKIDQLLAWGSQPIRKRPHQLTIPQRILMIALLEEADAGGIVRNAGFSDLAQRTGLAIRQVKNQMAKLRQFHYVRVSLSGGNTTGLTGRYNSVHALNLKHPAFGHQRASGGIVIFGPSVPVASDEHINYFYFQRRELLNGLSERRHRSQAQTNHSDELLKLASQAGNLRTASTWIFLNWLCHDLASRVLSEFWQELPDLTAGEELTKSIADKIRGDWLSGYRAVMVIDDEKNPGRKKAILSKQPELSMLPLIETSLSKVVCDIAIGLKKALITSNVLPEQIRHYHFQILPVPNNSERGVFALEITALSEHQPRSQNEFVLAIVYDSKKKKVTTDSVVDIYALTHNTLEMIGLASPPLACPMLSSAPKRKKTNLPPKTTTPALQTR